MSAPVKNSSSVDSESKALDAFGILKDLFFTAVITLLILTPIVIIRTKLDQGSLTWHFRLDKAALILSGVVAFRGLMHLFVWNPSPAAAEIADGVKSIWRILVPVFKWVGRVALWFALLFFLVLPIIRPLLPDIDVGYEALAVIPLAIVAEWLSGLFSLGSKYARLTGSQGKDGEQRVASTLLILALALPFILLLIGNKSGLFPGWDKRGIDFAITILIYVMLGWGLNVVVGLAGLLDLGYVAFYAVGAYAYALLSTVYFPLWFGPGIVPWAFYITLPVAGLLAATWGIILGFPVLRLRGDYLAIVTLAFGEIIRLVLINWFSFTNGPQGINVPKITFFGLPFKEGEGSFSAFFGIEYNRIQSYIFLYFVILALALLTYFVTRKLRRLPIGRAWEALREDEIACRSLGINTTSTKLTAFSIGASFGGLAGSFFAARQGFVSPESFVYIESALILAIVVLGGLGSQIGIVFSALAIIGAFELFREMNFLTFILPDGTEPVQFRMLAVGLAMVLMMRFRPRGFVTKREPTVFLKEKKSVSGDLVAQGHG